jgi:septum site-determining protein MinC
MSKIAIISRPEQGVLIDVGGCSSNAEAFELLRSTLKVSSKFWTEPGIGLNIASLSFTSDDVAELHNLVRDAQVKLTEVFAQDQKTMELLSQAGITIGKGEPMTVLSIDSLTDPVQSQSAEGDEQLKNDLSSVTIYGNDSAAAELLPSQQTDGKKPIIEDPVLYLKQTLRAGQAVSHKGHLVIVGDVNAGAEVEAQGDITIWGCLRGIAHAGIGGNRKAEIRALKLAPIQIRIGSVIARSPDRNNFASPNSVGPELAKLVGGKICITGNAVD